MSIYKFFGNILPESFIAKVEKRLIYAGVKDVPEIWVGRIIVLTLLLTAVFGLSTLVVQTYAPTASVTFQSLTLKLTSIFWGLAVLMLFTIPLIFYLHITMLSAIRVERAESEFPDFLYNIASVIRGGMTPVQAFFLSAKTKEFGILGKEARKAYEKAITTGMISVAFSSMAERIDSEYIRSFATFFKRAVISGGKIVELLESYADYLRDILFLKKELKQRTTNYMIFLGMISAVIMPFLLSLAYTYILFSQHLVEAANIQHGTTNAVITIGMQPKITLHLSYLLPSIFIYMLLSGLLTAALIGVLRKGRIIFGLKYALLVWFTSFIVFYISLMFLTGFMGMAGIGH